MARAPPRAARRTDVIDYSDQIFGVEDLPHASPWLKVAEARQIAKVGAWLAQPDVTERVESTLAAAERTAIQ